MPAYRRGRRVFTPGERQQNGPCDQCLSFIFTLLVVIGPPLLVYITEFNRYCTFMSLSDVIDMDITELSGGAHALSQSKAQPNALKEGSPVHGQTKRYSATTYDPEMDLRIHSSFLLSRKTEYCQWEEIRGQSCEKCTRTASSSSGGRERTTTTETYDCNCVTTFDYIKSWKHYRINSILFDQPAAHHNPQRDPMPSKKFLSKDAIVDFGGGRRKEMNGDAAATAPTSSTVRAHLAPAMLRNGIRNTRQRTIKWVKNGIPPVPPFYARWIPDRNRYDDSNDLFHIMKNNKNNSNNRNDDNFMYVGDGYFFSPYKASNTERIFKYFMQYLEGTLLDWQIGDLLMPISCEAGDIRFRYTVQDPLNSISILGQVSSSSLSTSVDFDIEPIKVSSHSGKGTGRGRSEAEVGLVHEGIHSVQDMIIAEDRDSLYKLLIFRVILLLWSIWITAYRDNILIKKLFRLHQLESHSTNLRVLTPTRIALTLCIWCGLVGLTWSKIWGIDLDSSMLVFASVIFGLYVHRFPPQPFLSGNESKMKND
eukprot:CAMPEP_0203664674 /NCGR_PEP_ID=MMETSP0090-20130426/2053_1 /ASSEMBLY_ACC=CAM_ASM_001088 /TAXON_ID=426623 /ORGANISM="Chaetoceros affinis, Strain CCMP159" /LENGTH=535 /DNA_ID=CAMNT_0050528007 /DNA_START=54 /DNA_END=1661 /DNA_ORIENTATION=+